jgi:hypothetical protein
VEVEIELAVVGVGEGENEETCRRIANSSVALVNLTIFARRAEERAPPYVLTVFDNCTTDFKNKCASSLKLFFSGPTSTLSPSLIT